MYCSLSPAADLTMSSLVVFAYAKLAEQGGSVHTAGHLEKVATRAHNAYNKYEGMHSRTQADIGHKSRLVDE